MKPLGLDRLADTSTSRFDFSWSEDLPGVTLSHFIRLDFQETTEVPAINLRQTFQRLVCHILVDRLPADGLGELCESIADVYEFYIARPKQIQTSSQPQQIKVKIGKTYERPTFKINEE